MAAIKKEAKVADVSTDERMKCSRTALLEDIIPLGQPSSETWVDWAVRVEALYDFSGHPQDDEGAVREIARRMPPEAYAAIVDNRSVLRSWTQLRTLMDKHFGTHQIRTTAEKWLLFPSFTGCTDTTLVGQRIMEYHSRAGYTEKTLTAAELPDQRIRTAIIRALPASVAIALTNRTECRTTYQVARVLQDMETVTLSDMVQQSRQCRSVTSKTKSDSSTTDDSEPNSDEDSRSETKERNWPTKKQRTQ